MTLSTASQAADGSAGWDEQGGSKSCATEKGDGSTSLRFAPKRCRQQGQREDTPSVSAPAPDTNASQINRPCPGHRVRELVHLGVLQSQPGRLGATGEAGASLQSKRSLQPQRETFTEPSSLIPGGMKPKQYLFTEDRGENEIKEVSSLSMTPTPPKRGLRNQLCFRQRRNMCQSPEPGLLTAARAPNPLETGDTTTGSGPGVPVAPTTPPPQLLLTSGHGRCFLSSLPSFFLPAFNCSELSSLQAAFMPL